MEFRFFVVLMEAFQFSKFHGNKAKHDKSNAKRGLSMKFIVTNGSKTCKFILFLQVSDQIIS